jgi:hypothetical protein
MLISNPSLIAGLAGVAGVAFFGRLLLARRELRLKNAYGIPVFPTFIELVIHRTLKATTSALFVIALIGAGAAYLLGLDLLVEESFASGLLWLLAGAGALVLIFAGAGILKKKRGRVAANPHGGEEEQSFTAETHPVD